MPRKNYTGPVVSVAMKKSPLVARFESPVVAK